jgi:uncharacterized protein with ParB-like and HNH nuclease domain
MASIKQDLTNRNESVERVYGFNAENRFLVNRRYQRKLVWSIDEKRAFVDSLRQGFPVPLILLADVLHDEEDRFEIIDGMQRLNAIISFIEGEFDLEGKYFDLRLVTSCWIRNCPRVQKSSTNSSATRRLTKNNRVVTKLKLRLTRLAAT